MIVTCNKICVTLVVIRVELLTNQRSCKIKKSNLMPLLSIEYCLERTFFIDEKQTPMHFPS